MAPWNEIDTLLLDLDGTLLDLHFDTYFWLDHLPRRFAEQHRLPLQLAKAEVKARLAREAGTLRWYCIEHWSREFEIDVLALKHEVAHLIAVHQGAEKFLQAAKRANKHIVLVTNAHAQSLALKMQRTGLGKYFDDSVCSHALGAAKEQIDFWDKLHRRLAFDQERTLCVDDNLAVLQAAKDFGIRHLLAVRRPDSQAPARDIEGFACTDGVVDLIYGRTSLDYRPEEPRSNTRSRML